MLSQPFPSAKRILEERPTALRSYFVDKYVRELLNKSQDPENYNQKLEVVRMMIVMKVDNRVLNNMR